MNDHPTTAAPLLNVEAVSVRFGAQRVLQDISLAVPRGQTVVIIGESGCGKTVMLKLLIGLLRPTAGRVTFDGKELVTLTERELTRERLRFGFLFQQAALFDSLDVLDNVAFGPRQQGKFTEDEIREVVRQRLREVGLPHGVEHKKPAELSGGMRKRVGLARALALDPEVMLYDEPTTGLDPIMTDVINELILRTRARTSGGRAVTSVVVTHDMKTVRKVADRIVMFYPLARLRPPAADAPGEPQILFDGGPADLDECADPRVRQFIEGEARDRLDELGRDQVGRDQPAGVGLIPGERRPDRDDNRDGGTTP